MSNVLRKILSTVQYVNSHPVASVLWHRCLNREQKYKKENARCEDAILRRHIQGSCAGFEFKASFEKSLNFIKLKSPWIVLENESKVLKSLEFAYVKLSTRLGDWELPATVAIKRVEELP